MKIALWTPLKSDAQRNSAKFIFDYLRKQTDHASSEAFLSLVVGVASSCKVYSVEDMHTFHLVLQHS